MTAEAQVQHTPGPWQVLDETDVLALAGTPSSIVVASTKFFEGPSTSWERANARLIAAAPDLLDAARAIVQTLDVLAGEIPQHPRLAADCADLRAAVHKAIGKQP